MRCPTEADEIFAADAELPIRELRGSRRRPDEVIADQRWRIFEGLAAALAYHGYEDTKITDIVELAGVSRPAFYEHFEGKEDCFAAAYEDGSERLTGAIEAAIENESGWVVRLSAALRAALEFLAAQPTLAHLLLVESLAPARPARLEHEHRLDRLAQSLRPPPSELAGVQIVPAETARLLAGGVASHLSGRILAGEAEGLSSSHELLLRYLLTPSFPAALKDAAEKHADGG